jgi:hypothetical protein
MPQIVPSDELRKGALAARRKKVDMGADLPRFRRARHKKRHHIVVHLRQGIKSRRDINFKRSPLPQLRRIFCEGGGERVWRLGRNFSLSSGERRCDWAREMVVGELVSSAEDPDMVTRCRLRLMMRATMDAKLLKN